MEVSDCVEAALTRARQARLPSPWTGRGICVHLIFGLLRRTKAQWLSTSLLSNNPSIHRAEPFSVDIHKVSRIRAPWLSIRPLSDTLSIHRAEPACLKGES